MTHLQTVERAAEVLRAQVCPTCPYRQEGAANRLYGAALPCEHVCPLFANLPVLANAVEQLDPLIGDRQKRLTGLVDAIGRIPVGEHKKHYRFGRGTVEAIDNVFPK